MVNQLASELVTLTAPIQLVVFFGAGVLFALGCSLTHKSRVFYVLPILCIFIGHLFVQGQVLTGEYATEWVKQAVDIVHVLAIAMCMLCAVLFGEKNIERHKVRREVSSNGKVLV